MVFKCLHNLVPDYLVDKFTLRSQVHNRTTWHSNNNKLNIPYCRLSTGQRSFTYRGTKLWNSLSDDLKHIQSPILFKCRLIIWFFSNDIVIN